MVLPTECDVVLPTSGTWCYLQRVGHGVTYSEWDMVLPTEWDMVLPTADHNTCNQLCSTLMHEGKISLLYITCPSPFKQVYKQGNWLLISSREAVICSSLILSPGY